MVREVRRFFVDPALLSTSTVTLGNPEAHHIISVLRLREGARILLLDGTGREYEAEITKLAKDRVEVLLISSHQATVSAPELDVGLAMLKGKKMDLLYQKLTELGVSGLYPFVSERCVVREGGLEKEARWRRLAKEACKQCGQAKTPHCHSIKDFDTLLAMGRGYDLKLILWEAEQERSLGEFLGDATTPRSVLVLIGPEGGFSETEIEKARDAGFHAVSLGNLVLRAETAGLAVVAILQYLLGNLRPLPKKRISSSPEGGAL